MKTTTEIRKYLTEKIFELALYVCPEGDFKIELAKFIITNIWKL